MVKCKKSVPKALIKEDCLWIHESTTFRENLMLSGHFEVFISHREGGENGKVQKVSPKGKLQREMPWLAQDDHF